ncbi:MAG: hypothetical protein ACJAVT_000048 [Yoonia sp.]|jgi:hypothetical protein
MAVSTTKTVLQQEACCSCEEMLHEQWLHVHQASLSRVAVIGSFCSERLLY